MFDPNTLNTTYTFASMHSTQLYPSLFLVCLFIITALSDPSVRFQSPILANCSVYAFSSNIQLTTHPIHHFLIVITPRAARLLHAHVAHAHIRAPAAVRHRHAGRRARVAHRQTARAAMVAQPIADLAAGGGRLRAMVGRGGGGQLLGGAEGQLAEGAEVRLAVRHPVGGTGGVLDEVCRGRTDKRVVVNAYSVQRRFESYDCSHLSSSRPPRPPTTGRPALPRRTCAPSDRARRLPLRPPESRRRQSPPPRRRLVV